MNRTNARSVPFAAVVAMVVAAGCVSANSVSYYYGYSQPTLLSASSSTDSFGSQNVSFVQASAPVSSLYQTAQPYQAAPSSPTTAASGTVTLSTPSTASQSGASAGASYTSSYFQSTYATTTTASAPSSAGASQSASQQTQALAYNSYMQTPASTPSTGSGPSAITVAYMSAYSVAVSTPVPGISTSSSPLGTSYFQVASALSPLNTTSSSSAPPKVTQIMTPYGPRFMVDIYNPEPGTVVLLVGGFGVLFAFRKRLMAR